MGRGGSCTEPGCPVSICFLIHRTEGLVDAFSQGLERLCPISRSVLHGIEPRLKDFHQLLLHPPKVQDLRQQNAPGDADAWTRSLLFPGLMRTRWCQRLFRTPCCMSVCTGTGDGPFAAP